MAKILKVRSIPYIIHHDDYDDTIIKHMTRHNHPLLVAVRKQIRITDLKSRGLLLRFCVLFSINTHTHTYTHIHIHIHTHTHRHTHTHKMCNEMQHQYVDFTARSLDMFRVLPIPMMITIIALDSLWYNILQR
jgi:hypothetical protein